MSTNTWEFWEFIFSLFLFFTSIFGYFSVGYIVFIERASNFISDVIILTWILLPIALFFSFIFKDSVSLGRENYVVVLSICLLTFCSSAALGANMLEKKFEESSLVNNKALLITLRIIVLVFSSITIACATGAVRAGAYHMNFANYSYSEELATYITSKKEKEIEISNNRKFKCKSVINTLEEYKSDFFIQSGFLEFIFRAKDLVQIKGVFPYSIEFYNRPASGRTPIDVNVLTFENGSGIACHVNIPLDSTQYFSSKTINGQKLSEFINMEIERKSSIVDSINNKPSSVIPYALANSYEILGGQTLKVNPLNEYAKILNFVTLWFFNILTGIIFYLVLRAPNNQT